jgi:membrane fusion protein (multidrug efflux system)
MASFSMPEDAHSSNRLDRPPEAPRAAHNANAGDHQPPERPRGDPPREKKRPFLKRPGVAGIFIVVAIVLIVGGTLWWRHSREYEATDDAFVDVVAQRVSSQVPGRVARVLVNDNADVHAGDVLVELDPADFNARLEQARAALAQAQAQVAQAEAQRAIREAEVEQARAAENAAATGAANAATDLKRLEEARSRDEGAASEQQLDHARADERSTAAQQRAADKAVAAATAQLALVARQIEAARASVRAAEAQVAEAQLTLSYAQIKAMVDGRIANKTVTAGNYIEPGTDLMAIVPRAVYVTADFKETQLARIRPGQPVEVTVDAYPTQKLRGHVDSVQPASGSAFTPIPAQNAAGNWVKVVQRVPVKIALDELPSDPAERLGPGMSVGVRVSVR